MNKLIWFLAILLLGSMNVVLAQQKNKDAYVKNLFSIIKNEDREAYQKLFPDAVAMKEILLGTIFKNAPDNAETREAVNGFLKNITDSSLAEDINHDYERVIKQASRLGVDWTKANLVNYTIDSALQDEDGFNAPTLTGKIYFNVGPKEYFIFYNEIIWHEKYGWLGANIKRMDEKSKENDEDKDDVEVEGIKTENDASPANMEEVKLIEVEPAKPTTPASPSTPAKPAAKPKNGKTVTGSGKKS